MGHDDKVKPGDISLCLRCGQLLRFDADLEPVLALESELEELDPRQRRMIAMARKHIPSLWRR